MPFCRIQRAISVKRVVFRTDEVMSSKIPRGAATVVLAQAEDTDAEANEPATVQDLLGRHIVRRIWRAKAVGRMRERRRCGCWGDGR